MSKTITIPDDVYRLLEEAAGRRGSGSVESMLEEVAREEKLHRRQEAIRRIKELHAYVAERYGRVPDSTESIREDRAR